jgi:DNA-binding GntR family transcriptional regulator
MIQKQEYMKKNLSDIVVEYITHKILTGEYKEGDRIVESKVAQELSISRAPVREGIIELQNQGLIKYIPRKGNFITRMTMKDVKEVFDIRLLLENSVIEILINEKKLTKEDYNRLEQIIEEMMEIARFEGDIHEKIIEINKKDIEFHTFLWEKSDSKRRVKILTDLIIQLQLAMVIDTQLTGNLETTVKDHYDIVKFLREGNIEQSKKALRDHIISYRKGSFGKEIFMI